MPWPHTASAPAAATTAAGRSWPNRTPSTRADQLLEALAWRAAASGATAALARWVLAQTAANVPFVTCTPVGLLPPNAGHYAMAAHQQEALAALGLHALLVSHVSVRLRRATPPPLMLFVRGDPTLLQHPKACAIVGSRRASARSVTWARGLAESRARAGQLVISGGAMGIDAAAHAGALDAGAPTLAYLGTPIDRIYPALNAPLFRRMLAAGGALVSEHPPLSITFKTAHAARNRLIASHACLLVVAEAGLASGTLGAMRHAWRCGTPVWCAPRSLGGEREGLEAALRRGWAQPMGDSAGQLGADGAGSQPAGPQLG